MMHLALLICATLLLATAAAAQMNWFTPSALNVTCLIQQRCIVNAPCTPISQTLTIDHNPEQGLTKFTLPDGTLSEGVLGVMSINGIQTLAATTSANAEKMYRINIFSDSTVSIGIMNFIDRPEDAFLYGTCKSPES